MIQGWHCLFILMSFSMATILPVIHQPGDIYIVGIYSIFSENHVGQVYDKMALFSHLLVKDMIKDENMVISMRAAVENKTEMQIGYVAYDAAGNQTKLTIILTSILLDKRYRNIRQFRVNENENHCNCKSEDSIYNIATIISLVSPQLNKLVSKLLLPYNMLVLGLKDKSVSFEKYANTFPNFVPIEKSYDQALSFLHMVEHFRWEKIGLISFSGASETQEAVKEVKNIANLLSQNSRSICYIAEQTDIQKLSGLINKLQNSSIEVIYMIGDGLDTFSFLYELDTRSVHNKTIFVVGSYMLSTVLVSFLSEEILRGLFFTKVNMQKHYGYGDENIYDDLWVHKLLIDKNKSSYESLTTFSKRENLTAPLFLMEFLRETLLQLLIKDLDIYAIQNITENFVRNNQFGDPYAMTNIKSANEKTVFSTIRIPNKLTWSSSPTIPPKAKCIITECPPGSEVRIGYVDGADTHWQEERGWVCTRCRINYVKNIYGSGSCKKCLGVYVSNENRTYCFDPYVNVYLKSTDQVMLVIYSLCGIKIFVLVFLIILFTLYKSTPVVRASDYIMTLLQLLTHLLICLMIVSFFVGRPTRFMCRYRSVLIGLLLTWVVSITFVKTQRAFYLFKLRRRVTKEEVRMTKAGCWFVILLICSIDICVSFVHMLHEPVNAHEILFEKTLQRHFSCSSEKHLLVQIIFVVMTSLACVIQGFRARNLPENFNETKYITFSAFTSTLVLLALFPLHYSQKNNRDKTVVNIIVLLSMNMTCFIIMHAKKAILILVHPKRNTIKVFQESLFQTIKEQVDEESAKRRDIIAS